MLALIREQAAWCEANGVEILCCPEAVLGGLADYAREPTEIAIDVEAGQLDALLASVASDGVATILGFTEIDREGRLYNSAALWYQKSVVGIYRKLHPAINKSVYHAGNKMPLFSIGGLTFGIIICNDSNYPETAKTMAANGAEALFVPTNNGLPLSREWPDLVALARKVDIALAIENRITVIRADVAGRTDTLESYGSTEIVDRDGTIISSARRLRAELVVAEIQDLGSQSCSAAVSNLAS